MDPPLDEGVYLAVAEVPVFLVIRDPIELERASVTISVILGCFPWLSQFEAIKHLEALGPMFRQTCHGVRFAIRLSSSIRERLGTV
jgi:hypothetical protein